MVKKLVVALSLLLGGEVFQADFSFAVVVKASIVTLYHASKHGRALCRATPCKQARARPGRTSPVSKQYQRLKARYIKEVRNHNLDRKNKTILPSQENTYLHTNRLCRVELE